MGVSRRKLGLLWYWFVHTVTAPLPDIAPIMRLRGYLLGLFMKRRGTDFQVTGNAILRGLENIEVGDHVYLANGVVILGGGGVYLGDGVMCGPYTVIASGDHTMDAGSFRFGKSETKPIRIGDGSWLGAHVTVTGGASIGKGCLVGANAVVTRDTDDMQLLYGVPAVPVKSLCDGVSDNSKPK